MSAPAPRPAQRAPGTGAAPAGVEAILKVVFAVLAVFVIGFGIWGYQRAHTPGFKLECAAYQAHAAPMGFPDNLLCLTFWSLS